MTVPDTTPVHRLAHAALRSLCRGGTASVAVALPSGAVGEIAYRGPGIPERLPDEIADYETIRLQRSDWWGAHRLVIKAPLIVLDLAWNADEPMRIMTFCRGDWEGEFLERLA